MIRVVFICTGNICRSPTAEALLREKWKQSGYDGLIVSSMGIHGLDKQEASENAKNVCKENDIDLSEHRSRRLDIPELESADIIFSMEKVQKEFLKLFFPKFDDKSFLLGAWPAKETRKSDIKDPMGSTLKTYKQVYKIINEHIDRIIPEIREYYY